MNGTMARKALAPFVLTTSLALVGYTVWDRKQSQCEAEKEKPQRDKIVFLGSGSSTGCPRPLCSLLFASEHHKVANNKDVRKMREQLAAQCTTSVQATKGNPRDNPDYRNNPSLLISKTMDNGEHKNIIIDVGKTFREGAIRWMPHLGIQSVDSIVLTHEHMDAAAGLDDIRGVQKYFYDEQQERKQVAMPLFLSPHCLGCLQGQFPWLFPKPKKDQSDAVKRHVASFDVTLFESFVPFEVVPGFYVTPLPVKHGEDLVSYGFAFSIGDYNVVYLSDISRMLDETMEFIQTKLPQPTHLLVLDALHLTSPNPVHYRCAP